MSIAADVGHASTFEAYQLMKRYSLICLFVCVYLIMKFLSYNFFTLLIKFSSRSIPTGFVRLDEDILSPLAGKKELYAYETNDFWQQIKTPG